MKALLKNYRQSPRKVRLVADMIRGKSISDAQIALRFMPQKSSSVLAKLLDSAVANARHAGLPTETLFVKSIAVNKGSVIRRFKPMSRGRANAFSRTMSIVTLELGAGAAKKAASPKKKVTAKKETATK